MRLKAAVLPLFLSLVYATSQSPSSSPRMDFPADGWEIVEVAEGVKYLEEPKGLPLDPIGPRRKVGSEGADFRGDSSLLENTRGIRHFRFILRPGETLKAGMKPMDATKVQIMLGVPKVDDPCISRIHEINRDERPIRARQIEFTNPTNKPYPLLLVVTGIVRYSYRIDLERH